MWKETAKCGMEMRVRVRQYVRHMLDESYETSHGRTKQCYNTFRWALESQWTKGTAEEEIRLY